MKCVIHRYRFTTVTVKGVRPYDYVGKWGQTLSLCGDSSRPMGSDPISMWRFLSANGVRPYLYVEIALHIVIGSDPIDL